MPIKTPDQALTLDELPTATAGEPGIQAIVSTTAGAKKLPIATLFEPFSMLVGSVQFYSFSFPTQFCAPLLGGELDPADFDDNLQILKQRVPNEWIVGDKIKLPLCLDHVLQQDIMLQPGRLQDDAIQDIKGSFWGLDGMATGPFKNVNGKQNHEKPGVRPVERYQSIQFDASMVARTAEKTRESTLNGLLCLITGQNNAKTTKKYYLIHPDHGLYAGWQIELPVGKNGEGIGFNPDIMTDKPPLDFDQNKLAEIWRSEDSSDPLGLAIKLNTRSKWDFDFEDIYKTFKINGKEVYITADKGGVKVLGGRGTESITFTGTPTYTTRQLWGSGYGITYTSTGVVIAGNFAQFAISGLPVVTIDYQVKGCDAILSLTSNSSLIDQKWWSNLERLCPPDRLNDLKNWLNLMPNGIYNGANLNDTLDNLPKSRFYLHHSGYKKVIPEQKEIFEKYKTAQSLDNTGIYAGALLPDFKLSNFVKDRVFKIEGFDVRVEADAEGVTLSADKHYIKVKATPRVANHNDVYGQNQAVIYDITPQSYFVGSETEEINLTSGWNFSFLIYVKEKNVMVYCLYFDKNKVNDMIRYSPPGEQQKVEGFFEKMPKDWENTTNRDGQGNQKANFWLEGK